MDHVNLLPRNATALEKALAEVDDPFATLVDEFNSIFSADVTPSPSVLPYLIWEYGLGELSPYIPNLYALVEDGIRWQRVRGTPAAAYKAVGWLGYSGSLEYEPVRHRRWNRFQLGLTRIRDAEAPDLARLEGVSQLSAPARSLFRRGFHGYDVRAAETSYQRLSGAIVGDHSGVRFGGGAVQWSFGRTHEVEHVLSQAELIALGAWVLPIESDYWVDLDILWVDADYLWATPGVQARRDTIVEAITAAPIYLVFRDAGGEVIGYARATARPVAAAASGPYSFGGGHWITGTDTPTNVLVFARTGFGHGAGFDAESVSVLFGPTLGSGVGPGQSWVEPGGLSGGVETVPDELSIQFGSTVRDHVQVMLGLDGPYTVSDEEAFLLLL